MLASLAIDRPRVVAWTHHGHLIVHFHPTAASQEAKIWLVALIPSAIVVGIGVAAVFIRRGVYLVCASMFIISAVLPHRLDTWVGITRCATRTARISTPTHGRRTSSTAASGSRARGRRS